MRLATSVEWVTVSRVRLTVFNSTRSSASLSVLAWSRAPVGSSARSSLGSLTKARRRQPVGVRLRNLGGAVVERGVHLFQEVSVRSQGLALKSPCPASGHHDVFQHRTLGQEVVGLKDKADGLVSESCRLLGGEFGHL